jgi:hypothetical protein
VKQELRPFAFATALALCAFAQSAHAQTFPSHPITVVVPFPAHDFRSHEPVEGPFSRPPPPVRIAHACSSSPIYRLA